MTTEELIALRRAEPWRSFAQNEEKQRTHRYFACTDE